MITIGISAKRRLIDRARVAACWGCGQSCVGADLRAALVLGVVGLGLLKDRKEIFKRYRSIMGVVHKIRKERGLIKYGWSVYRKAA